ncbi:MAG: BrnT family toxin [Acidobacteriia bacterium]|nr:BrnT family toxin [Terriglobia bacterium]
MRFEWDDAKARLNAGKHGVTFDQAITAFDDPYGLVACDEKHSTAGECREWLIGESDDGILVVVFTRREHDRVRRRISARRASRRERGRHEEYKRIPL